MGQSCGCDNNSCNKTASYSKHNLINTEKADIDIAKRKRRPHISNSLSSECRVSPTLPQHTTSTQHTSTSTSTSSSHATIPWLDTNVDSNQELIPPVLIEANLSEDEKMWLIEEDDDEDEDSEYDEDENDVPVLYAVNSSQVVTLNMEALKQHSKPDVQQPNLMRPGTDSVWDEHTLDIHEHEMLRQYLQLQRTVHQEEAENEHASTAAHALKNRRYSEADKDAFTITAEAQTQTQSQSVKPRRHSDFNLYRSKSKEKWPVCEVQKTVQEMSKQMMFYHQCGLMAPAPEIESK
mmetsp:Transcript_56440/g.93969  ORF Transcript_56440/g.93969 Transcript_56440/m.93969 type:complete len:293 (+) Transcript_56440:29-907(+)